MNAASEAFENPFPAEAVTTYGARATNQPVAQLRSLRTTVDAGSKALSGWVTQGSVVAISGAHGGGKTFVLQQLSDHLRQQNYANPQVIYAKADTTSFTDLYGLVLGQLDRRKLQDLVSEAVRLRALTLTGAARATLTEKQEIEKTRSLEASFSSAVLDPNVLAHWLYGELQAASQTVSVSGRVGTAIGLLSEPLYGEAAYSWLTGATPATTLPNPALASPLFAPESGEAATTVIAALETIARLHGLAERSFVLMIDQMEKLLGAGTAVDNSSYLKKLVEQLKAQRAILVLAGTPAGWKRLPLETTQRLWSGDPIAVGDLAVDETRDLVTAFPAKTGYTANALAQLRDLTEGNPRAILQTTFQVCEACAGDLVRADDEILRAAATVGTLKDRARVATEVVVQTAVELGFRTQLANTSVGSGDRLLVAPTGREFVVVTAIVPDRVTEAEIASRLTALVGELANHTPPASLIVVAIGYASDRVQGLIAQVSEANITYREATFADELRRVLARLSEPTAPLASDAASATPDPNLASQIEQLQLLISQVEAMRRQAEAEVKQRFADNVARTAAPEIEQKSIETRQEMRDGLETLADLYEHGTAGTERDAIRALLIANESRIRDQAFDLLGNVYLSAVNEALRSGWPQSQPGSDDTSWLGSIRRNLLPDMRAALTVDDAGLFASPPMRWFVGVAAGLVLGSVALAAIVRYPVLIPFGYNMAGAYISAGAIAVLGGVGAFTATEISKRPQFRYRGYVKALRRMQR